MDVNVVIGVCLVFTRDSICYSAYMLWQFRLSVCHTGGSAKNG